MQMRTMKVLEAAEAEVASGRLALADATDALAAAKSDAAAGVEESPGLVLGIMSRHGQNPTTGPRATAWCESGAGLGRGEPRSTPSRGRQKRRAKRNTRQVGPIFGNV